MYFTVQSQGYAPKKVLAAPAVMDTVVATFTYDGDGNRVSQTIGGVTTYFVGNYYEKTGSTITKYYYAGTQRVAMRNGSTLSYLLSDHLSSTSITTNSSGTLVSEVRYKACPLRSTSGVLREGETRYTSGTMPTKYTYTGQYSNVSDFGWMYYNARWYDPYLNQWTQPDSIVPDPYNSQDYNRYSYARNNPLKYTDPSGHDPWWCETADCELKYVYRKGAQQVVDTMNLLKGGRKEALGYIATLKGIHLAPGDHWNYAEYISFHDGTDSITLGWTPSNDSDAGNPYYDKNGNLQNADDQSVFLTGSAFDNCSSDANCIIRIMAHEAGHSWIELKAEQTATVDNAGIKRLVGVTHQQEEMYVDILAQLRFGSLDPSTVDGYRHAEDELRNSLESSLGIDLSNIGLQIFGE